MNRTAIRLFDLWPETMAALTHEGLLLNSVGIDGQPDTMTIGWLSGGVIWGRPILTVYVRPSRYTYSRLEEVGEFTVNVLPPADSEALQLCGTVSGRDVDKFARTGLKPIPAQKVQVPIIEQGVIHYECQVVHRNDLLPVHLQDEIKVAAYPEGNFHRVYFGKVLAAYATADARVKLQRPLL